MVNLGCQYQNAWLTLLEVRASFRDGCVGCFTNIVTMQTMPRTRLGPRVAGARRASRIDDFHRLHVRLPSPEARLLAHVTRARVGSSRSRRAGATSELSSTRTGHGSTDSGEGRVISFSSSESARWCCSARASERRPGSRCSTPSSRAARRARRSGSTAQCARQIHDTT